MFFTTPNAASTPVEQLRIGKGGNVGIKAAARLYFDGVAGTGHTYIDEESNDLLRIAVGATEVMKLDPNSQISLSNNDLGTANTIYGKKAGEDLASGGNYNVLLGEMAGENVSTGVSNVAIGYSALKTSSANGDKNVAIGYLALEDMQADTDGDGQNVAVGFECAKNLSTGLPYNVNRYAVDLSDLYNLNSYYNQNQPTPGILPSDFEIDGSEITLLQLIQKICETLFVNGVQ